MPYRSLVAALRAYRLTVHSDHAPFRDFSHFRYVRNLRRVLVPLSRRSWILLALNAHVLGEGFMSMEVAGFRRIVLEPFHDR